MMRMDSNLTSSLLRVMLAQVSTILPHFLEVQLEVDLAAFIAFNLIHTFSLTNLDSTRRSCPLDDFQAGEDLS